jgi:hypothetical protein
MFIMYGLASAVGDLLSATGGLGNITEMVDGGMYRAIEGAAMGGEAGGLCDCLGACLEAVAEVDGDD